MEFFGYLVVFLVVVKSIEWVFEKVEIYLIIVYVIIGIFFGLFVFGIVKLGKEIEVLV